MNCRSIHCRSMNCRSTGPQLVLSCVLMLIDISYFFFSVVPVRQLFDRDTSAIFHRCSDGYIPTCPVARF